MDFTILLPKDRAGHYSSNWKKNILTNELNQDKTEKFKMNESKISPKDNYSLHNKTANKILIYLAQQISTESATRSFIQVSKSAGGG